MAKQREMGDLAKKDVWLSKEKRVKSKKKWVARLVARHWIRHFCGFESKHLSKILNGQSSGWATHIFTIYEEVVSHI